MMQRNRNYCSEVVGAVVAFVDCALWAVVALCIFVNSGRYEQTTACSVKQEQEEEGVAVKMAAVTAIPAPYATAPFSPTATVTCLLTNLEKQV
jgi:hypothetical protein